MKLNLFFILCAAFAFGGYLWAIKPENPVDVNTTPQAWEDERIVVHIPQGYEPANVYSDQVPLSEGWQCYAQDTCRRYGVDYALMLGLMDVESDFIADADSGWAYGLCQIGYINEEWLADDGIDIYTIKGNIEAACVILSDYLERYTEEQALVCYNEGEAGASEIFDYGIYSTKYSRSVKEAAQKWRAILNGKNTIDRG